MQVPVCVARDEHSDLCHLYDGVQISDLLLKGEIRVLCKAGVGIELGLFWAQIRHVYKIDVVVEVKEGAVWGRKDLGLYRRRFGWCPLTSICWTINHDVRPLNHGTFHFGYNKVCSLPLRLERDVDCSNSSPVQLN